MTTTKHRRRRSSLFPPRPPSYPPADAAGAGVVGASSTLSGSTGSGGGVGGGHRRVSLSSGSHVGERPLQHQRQRSIDGLGVSGSVARAVSPTHHLRVFNTMLRLNRSSPPSTTPNTQSTLGGSASLHGSINTTNNAALLPPAFAPGHTSLAASWSLVLPPKPAYGDNGHDNGNDNDAAAASLRALQDAGSYAVVGVWSGVPHGGGGAEGVDGEDGGCGHVLLDEEILASWSVDKGRGAGGYQHGLVGLDTVACPGCHARFHPRLEVRCQALDPQALERAFPEHALPGAVRSQGTCLVLGSGGSSSSSGAGTAAGGDVPVASASATTTAASIGGQLQQFMLRQPSARSSRARSRSSQAEEAAGAAGFTPAQARGDSGSSSSSVAPMPVSELRSSIAALLRKARAQRPKETDTGGLQSLTLHIEGFLAGSGPVRLVCYV